ncbi:MAG TPA: thioesterase domain-containing protein, partial [Candidatus Sulfotelmatobacter sp.]|nr:thioesterase domain-containing protein [Candidatus Sulfotelmatobacter sp.]
MNSTDQPVSMIDYLVPAWQRVLNRPVINAEDNFFDLGGDPRMAGELFRVISGSVGRDLPPLTLLQAPTIQELAKVLEQPRPPRFPDVVLLKKGSGGPPIFMTHGLGGSVMEVLNLARSLPSSHVVYGLQAPGSDGREKPLRRVEDLADLYLPAMRDVQPHGPYLLIGYSLGGL